MKPAILRPRQGEFLSSSRKDDLEKYISTQWLRAERSRKTQIDDHFDNWTKSYYGTPLEEIRTVPFYKASNTVVKLIRMFLDTFTARTLNLVFATRPLFVCEMLPRELRDDFTQYLNRKALYEWEFYKLCRELCHRGNKNGTAVTKTTWETDESIDVMPGSSGVDFQITPTTDFDGPRTKVIPFEDFYIYPISATCLNDADILFQRVRYTREKAEQLLAKQIWQLEPDTDVDSLVMLPQDIVRKDLEERAGLDSSYVEEVQNIECHLKYDLKNDGKQYSIVAVFNPVLMKLLDVYFNPYPQNICTFNSYVPFPKEELFFGESMCQLLGNSQEEVTRIHNERRDNSMLANTVCFKRRNGSLLPNPSTNWYPGKVWDLDDMTDLEVFEIGRNYDDTLQQETFTIQLAQQLSGINDVMQGASQGSQGKGGVYNTMGTIAMMQESNQRQDTNMKDLRESVGRIGRCSAFLQSCFGQDDPLINTFESSEAANIKQALTLLSSTQYRYTQLEVKSSDAGVNKEVERQNLMQMAQVVNQYGQTTLQMSQQLFNPQLAPGMRMLMNDIINMMKYMATRILTEFDEREIAEVLPDVAAAIETAIPGGSRGSKEGSSQSGPQSGGPESIAQSLSGSSLAALASMPSEETGPTDTGSMASGQDLGSIQAASRRV